jgi:hypothetical protein
MLDFTVDLHRILSSSKQNKRRQNVLKTIDRLNLKAKKLLLMWADTRRFLKYCGAQRISFTSLH